LLTSVRTDILENEQVLSNLIQPYNQLEHINKN